jgi:hypothetical protein
MLNRLQQSVLSIMRKVAERDRPIVSFVLIVYDMPAQAQNTVRSLLPDYQVGADLQDYEVLVVENESGNHVSADFLKTLPANFHYHLRKEDQPTPVHAINFGIQQARGENVCVMIDGARVLTPGIVRNIILGHRVSELAVVTVPGYHLGFELQQDAVANGYGVEQEQALMESIAWPDDGYRLFEIACFSSSCAPGFYLPHSESNCISMPREILRDLRGYDARFDIRGGGMVNLDLYKRACEYPGVIHVLLQGEGTFHQFHGGVTTGGDEAEARDRFIAAIRKQYQEIRGQTFTSPATNPVYLGEVSDHALKFVHLSSGIKLERLGKNAESRNVSV